MELTSGNGSGRSAGWVVACAVLALMVPCSGVVGFVTGVGFAAGGDAPGVTRPSKADDERKRLEAELSAIDARIGQCDVDIDRAKTSADTPQHPAYIEMAESKLRSLQERKNGLLAEKRRVSEKLAALGPK